jgi:hypothetical protein
MEIRTFTNTIYNITGKHTIIHDKRLEEGG